MNAIKPICLCMLATVTLQAQESPPEEECTTLFDFNGWHIGDEVNHSGDRCKTKDNAVVCAREIYTADLHVTADYYIIDSKLATVEIDFNSEDFDQVVRAYSAKLVCAPTQTETVLHNRMGAAFQNITVTWDTVDGPFVVSKYGATLTRGIGTLQTKKIVEWLGQQKAKQAAGLEGRL